MNSKKRWLGLVVSIIVFNLIMNLSAMASMGTVYKNSENTYDLSNDAFNASIRAGAGYLTGSATEKQYGSINTNTWEDLDWEIDNLYMTGLGFSLQKQWVAIHSDIWISTIDGEGAMDSIGLNSYTYAAYPAATEYDTSHHNDTDVSEGIIFDINCELLIPQFSTSNFTLGVILGYKYENYNWEAHGGTATIGGITSQFADGRNIVSYEQTFKTPYIGLGLRTSIENFELSGRVFGSTLVSGDSLDEHHDIIYRYEGDMNYGNMIAFDISATYSFTKQIALQLGYNYTCYDSLRGSVTITTIDGSNNTIATRYEDNGSMELDTSMASLSLIYKF